MAEDPKEEEGVKYHLLWDAEPAPEGVKKEDIPEGRGACDAMVFVSLLYPPDGSLSVAVKSLDGRVEGHTSMSSPELFKAWVMFGAALSRMPGLNQREQQLAMEVTQIVLGGAAREGCGDPGCACNEGSKDLN